MNFFQSLFPKSYNLLKISFYSADRRSDAQPASARWEAVPDSVTKHLVLGGALALAWVLLSWNFLVLISFTAGRKYQIPSSLRRWRWWWH